jgi:hypothetical protein
VSFPVPAAGSFAPCSAAVLFFRSSSSIILNLIASNTIISSSSGPTPTPIPDKKDTISSFLLRAALLASRADKGAAASGVD